VSYKLNAVCCQQALYRPVSENVKIIKHQIHTFITPLIKLEGTNCTFASAKNIGIEIGFQNCEFVKKDVPSLHPETL
jgi:hypothetical protein